jgi:hypothetical protein
MIRASFGFPGQPRVFCEDHRKSGMNPEIHDLPEAFLDQGFMTSIADS